MTPDNAGKERNDFESRSDLRSLVGWLRNELDA